MKKAIFIAIVLLTTTFSTSVFAQAIKDTTIVFNQKRIIIQDSLSRTRVTVLGKDSIEYKKVYEGIFTDEQSIESVNVLSEIGLNFPFVKKKAKGTMESHWAGFSYGRLTTADNHMNIGETAGIPLDKGKSNEVMFNIMDGIVPIIGHTFGLTSGFGFNWRSFHLDNNTHLIEDANGVTKAVQADGNTNYTYSRLRTLHLTVPLLLEWQPVFGKNKQFFMSAGVVGGWNVMSAYRVKYKNADGDKISKVEARGLNTNPLSLDFMGQIGYSSISIYAKYSPFSIFQKDKGPAINATSIGIQLDF
jgi:hypothetical protein